MSEKKTFEEMLERLDAIVRALEKGDVPLEQSLALYTEGAGLIKTCTELINQAEQTVVRVQKGADGAPVESPFAGDEE